MAGQQTSGKAGSAEKAQLPLWERLARPAPAPRSALTAERIASVAVGIADAEGLDAVTMRRLATELGVAPMAAYRYVTGKDELLELMVDFVHGELPPPDEDAGWREAMRTLATRIRDLTLAHPWLARTSGPVLTPNLLAVPERALTALDGLGLDADSAMAVFHTVIAYVRGSVGSEIRLARLREERGWSDGEETREGLAPQMGWLLGTGRYPAYLRYARESTRKDDPLWQFETGLDCVLDGIAARMGI